jgi:biotin-dependent carboxylase-like uncharacterized protein
MIRVLDPGPLTTVQDLGRPGYLRFGIPASGPVDRLAFVLANRLVGNRDGLAGLECTLVGPRLEIMREAVVAATGADMPLSVNEREVARWRSVRVRAGDVVRLGAATGGVRGYLAVSGGLEVPEVLGSRSTYLRGRLGGYDGRALRTGDEIRIGPSTLSPRERGVRRDAVPRFGGGFLVHVVLGPQADRFTPAGLDTFLRAPYEMLPQSDRMGARLRGPVIAHARGHDIISDGVPLGGIQVVGDGQPIILLVDRQSTGGYTKIAAVCSTDIGRVGQTRPGEHLKFRAIPVDDAHALCRAERIALERAIE